MAIVRCTCGNFYDDEKYGICPKCSKMDTGRQSNAQMRVFSAFTAPQQVQLDDQKTVAFGQAADERLLTGWLVCIKGAQRGRDYRLFSGFNRIGRQLQSDICLQDEAVSGENHCSVVYDPKSAAFYLVPGKGTLTYLNEALTEKAEKLETGDRIGLGNSLLEFIPFCQKEHIWERL